MSFYEDNTKGNFLLAVLSKGWKVDLDGKVHRTFVPAVDSPWLSSKYDEERRCDLWLMTLFKHFSILPWQCTGCWKIYYNPKTLKDLFRIYALQQRSDEENGGLARKCGIETRGFTGNLGGYAAFWYNRLFAGLDEAREKLKLIRKLVGSDDVQLKRGCTEMERWTKDAYNLASDRWGDMVNRRSLEVQAGLEALIEIPKPPKDIPEDLKKLIQNRWIDTAVEHSKATGDDTYLQYRDKKPITELVTYGGSMHQAAEFVGGKDGRNYLINLVGRREADRYFGTSEKQSILVPELEAD